MIPFDDAPVPTGENKMQFMVTGERFLLGNLSSLLEYGSGTKGTERKVKSSFLTLQVI